MTRKRKNRITFIAATVMAGGLITQFGGCISAGAQVVLASLDFCSVLGPDCVLGPIAPCGDPNTAEDDLLLDCPPPPVVTGT